MDREAKITKLVSQLKSDRSTWEESWHDLATNMMPSLDNFNVKHTDGERIQGDTILDSHPEECVVRFASGLNTMLTNSSIEWFGLKVSDESLSTSKWVQESLQDIQKRMMSILIQSNFNTEVYSLYLYLIVFGTAVLYIEYSPHSAIRFKTVHLNECLIRTDYNGDVDCVFRLYNTSPRKLIQEFGRNNVSQETREIEEKDDEKDIACIHAVFPKKDKSLGEWTTDFDYVSVYLEKETNHLLSEGGYEEFPYAVPRWFVSPDEEYGRGLGWRALPDIKTLYRMTSDMLIMGEKVVHPPVTIPESLVIGAVDLSSRGITTVRQNGGEIKPITFTGGLPFGIDFIERKKLQISQIFMTDQLELVEKKQMTATEVIKRSDQQMRLLAPALGRLQTEFLKIVIERTYNILSRYGYLPPLHPEIEARGLKIEYLSPIERAQRLHEVEAIQMLMEMSVPLVQADPSSFKIFKIEEIIKTLSSILGVPASLLRDSQEMRVMQKQEDEQMQAMLQKTENREAAETGKIMSETSLNLAKTEGGNVEG